MPNTKEFNKKIKSLTNTEKMTRTMKMVSASKLRRAGQLQASAKFYEEALIGLIARLSAPGESSQHPLLMPNPKSRKALVVVFTSDKGLCAGFNHNIIKRVLVWIREKTLAYQRIDLCFCGKRGWMAFKNTPFIKKYYEGITQRPDFSKANSLALDLTQWFKDGEYAQVFLAYNRFVNPLSQVPTIEQILPVHMTYQSRGGPSFPDKSTGADGILPPADYIFEPPAGQLLSFLLPRYLNFRIYYTLLENSAGEHGARMTAMDSASKNAVDLIDKYTLSRNRARQAAITKELIEIVSGAEALK